jgi:hypothetical protein
MQPPLFQAIGYEATVKLLATKVGTIPKRRLAAHLGLDLPTLDKRLACEWGQRFSVTQLDILADLAQLKVTVAVYA